MNNQIKALHGRYMLRRIWLFECTRIKNAHRTTYLNFLKKCRNYQIVPCFAKFNHHLKKKHENIFTTLNMSIVWGEIKQTRKELDALSQKEYNLHMELAKELRVDMWISVDAGTMIKAEISVETTTKK